MRKDRGFTLIELLVTIAVATILAGVGIPSMIDIVRINRRAAAANGIVTAVQQARSTAASLGVNVILCHSTSGSDCSGTDDPDWSEGWMLFMDDNRDNTSDSTDRNGTRDAGEPVIMAGGPHAGVAMPSTTGQLVFRPGYRVQMQGATIAVCVDGNGNDRWIAISPTGRPRVHDDDPGTSCPSP